jgi:hypothetical protein
MSREAASRLSLFCLPTWFWIGIAAAVIGSVVLAISASARHAAGTLALLARDRRVPWPIRGLLLFALLPIPGPFEEIVGAAALAYISRRLPHLWAEHRRRSFGAAGLGGPAGASASDGDATAAPTSVSSRAR